MHARAYSVCVRFFPKFSRHSGSASLSSLAAYTAVMFITSRFSYGSPPVSSSHVFLPCMRLWHLPCTLGLLLWFLVQPLFCPHFLPVPSMCLGGTPFLCLLRHFFWQLFVSSLAAQHFYPPFSWHFMLSFPSTSLSVRVYFNVCGPGTFSPDPLLLWHHNVFCTATFSPDRPLLWQQILV